MPKHIIYEFVATMNVYLNAKKLSSSFRILIFLWSITLMHYRQVWEWRKALTWQNGIKLWLIWIFTHMQKRVSIPYLLEMLFKGTGHFWESPWLNCTGLWLLWMYLQMQKKQLNNSNFSWVIRISRILESDWLRPRLDMPDQT